jgi:hypothetical protein
VRYTNRDTYEGCYKDGKKCGKGVYRYFATGDKYDGQWKDDKKHGLGKMQYFGKGREGEYQGYWENDRRHGEGVFVYKNGDIYSGWWRFGQKEGNGTFVSKETGMKMVGHWENGQIKSGRWVYPNGFYYEGSFVNNKPVGQGVWHCKDGNVVLGSFEQKKKEAEEDAPPEEEEDGAPAVQKYDLTWTSEANIV